MKSYPIIFELLKVKITHILSCPPYLVPFWAKITINYTDAQLSKASCGSSLGKENVDKIYKFRKMLIWKPKQVENLIPIVTLKSLDQVQCSEGDGVVWVFI